MQQVLVVSEVGVVVSSGTLTHIWESNFGFESDILLQKKMVIFMDNDLNVTKVAAKRWPSKQK